MIHQGDFRRALAAVERRQQDTFRVLAEKQLSLTGDSATSIAQNAVVEFAAIAELVEAKLAAWRESLTELVRIAAGSANEPGARRLAEQSETACRNIDNILRDGRRRLGFEREKIRRMNGG